MLLDYITEGPVVAAVLEGVSAIELVRKHAGNTEPKQALPGTIRGDYCHHSYAHCDKFNISIKNVIHASANIEQAESEILVWFSEKEITKYRRCDESEHYA